MERKKLNQDEIKADLARLAGWETDGTKISKRYELNNFADSLTFVNKVGELAEAADHHPDITFGWGYAVIELTTHDRGGVTDHDTALAEQIDAI